MSEKLDPNVFVGFQKLTRLSKGTLITEKIDGTNAQVLVTSEGLVVAGSRNRYLTVEDDNFGFARWVKDNEEELRKLGPGRHFGEWWGLGVQRGYGLKEKRFSLFNTGRWSNERPACCHVVPLLYAGEFTSEAVEKALADLAQRGSVASPGFMNPEGVVVFAGGSLFKKTLGGDGHKGQP